MLQFEKKTKKHMTKYDLEYVMRASQKVLFERLSTSSGLSEWFADNVNQKGKIFTESHLENLRIAQRSEKVKSKKSRSLKGRNNYWMKGDKNPAKRPEIRKKISDSVILTYKNRPEIKKIMSDR